MKNLALVLVAALLCGTAVAQSTTDAQALQQTLAKIVFAHDVSIISDLAHTSLNRETSTQLQEAVTAEKLTLSVADISIGSVSSIAQRNLMDLVTWLPTGRILDVTPAEITVSSGDKVLGREYQAQVEWFGAVGGPGPTPFPATLTLQEAVTTEKPQAASCSRYITGTITATYKGETAQWRPLYLLGCIDNAVVTLDLVMGNAVADFWNAEVYPLALLRQDGVLSRNPAVVEWFKTHASDTCTRTAACFEGGAIVIPKANIPTPVPTPAPLIQGGTSLPKGPGCSS